MTLGKFIGTLLVLLGGTVMLGWRLQIVPLVRVMPEFAPMVFNTALCFALAGGALLASFSDTKRDVGVTAIGVVLATIAALVLAEHGFQFDLGIDAPSLHAWLRHANARPGRMSAPSATAFLMTGAALILATRAHRSWTGAAVRILTLGVSAIGALGLAGYFVSAPLLFPEYWFAGIAVHTAAGLLLLSIGLWSAGKRFAWGRTPFFSREDERITFIGAAILVAIATSAGIASFAILQGRVQTLVGGYVVASLSRRVSVFQDMIELRENNAQIAANRPAVMRNLRVIHAGKDDGSHIANVQAVIDGFLKQGFAAIAYHDVDGKIVSSGGSFARAPAMSVTLATPEKAELLWDRGFLLRHRISMSDAGGKVGEITAEQPLPVLTRLTAEAPGNGDTWDMGICVRSGGELRCFPQRLNPRVFSAPLVNVAGEDLPMTRALNGETGITITRDYRAQNVMAAYGPIGGLGLGMVIKVDAVEVFKPIREQLQFALGLLLLLAAGGAVLLRSRIKPLATSLVDAVTAREKSENALRNLNAELELKRNHLEKANKLKSEFLANMSHELRTPLNGIIGFSEMMHDEKVGPVSPRHKEYLGDILNSARHLLELINDVLDLTKVEAGKIEFEPEQVELEKVVRETCDVVRAMSARKNLKIEIAIAPEVSSVVLDPAKLKQVLYNYLSNAIKFTGEGGRITVRAAPEGPKDFRLEVKDTGIGIKPEDLGKLFVEFQQLDATPAKKYQGTGLGLALTKKIVEAQGGRVGVDSTPGHGSVFFAVLPRIQAISVSGGNGQPKPAPVARTADISMDGSRTVLCIDDDPSSLKLTEIVLRNAGYATICETDAEAAFHSIEQDKPAAIVLDLLMPKLDGFEFLERCQRMKFAKDIPIILWSIMDLPHEDRSRLRALVRAIVTKGPGGAARLLEELENHIGVKR